MSRCQCITNNGQQCVRNSYLDGEYCWQHQKQAEKNNLLEKNNLVEKNLSRDFTRGPKKGGAIGGFPPRVRMTSPKEKKRVSMTSPKELQILKQSSEYYQNRIPLISEDEYKMIEPDLVAVNWAIRNGEIGKAVRHLTNIYEIADEHNFLTQHINYPGPGQLHKLVNYLDQANGQSGGHSLTRVLNRKQRTIFNQTYQHYQHQFRLLTPDEYELVRPNMELAFEAINRGDAVMAARYLINVYEIAEKHHFIPEEMTYPGPHDFSNLVDNLDLA